MDALDLARYLAAFIVVISLLGLFALAARKGWLKGFAAAENRKRRLQTLESLKLDARRRVVILRADGEDHILLLGPDGDTVLSKKPVAADVKLEPVHSTDAA